MESIFSTVPNTAMAEASRHLVHSTLETLALETTGMGISGLEKNFELHLSNGQVKFWFYLSKAQV